MNQKPTDYKAIEAAARTQWGWLRGTEYLVFMELKNDPEETGIELVGSYREMIWRKWVEKEETTFTYEFEGIEAWGIGPALSTNVIVLWFEAARR